MSQLVLFTVIAAMRASEGHTTSKVSSACGILLCDGASSLGVWRQEELLSEWSSTTTLWLLQRSSSLMSFLLLGYHFRPTS